MGTRVGSAIFKARVVFSRIRAGIGFSTTNPKELPALWKASEILAGKRVLIAYNSNKTEVVFLESFLSPDQTEGSQGYKVETRKLNVPYNFCRALAKGEWIEKGLEKEGIVVCFSRNAGKVRNYFRALVMLGNPDIPGAPVDFADCTIQTVAQFTDLYSFRLWWDRGITLSISGCEMG